MIRFLPIILILLLATGPVYADDWQDGLTAFAKGNFPIS
jgi:hypothetical protein